MSALSFEAANILICQYNPSLLPLSQVLTLLQKIALLHDVLITYEQRRGHSLELKHGLKRGITQGKVEFETGYGH